MLDFTSDVELSFAYEHVFERHLARDALANVATHPKTLEAVRRQRGDFYGFNWVMFLQYVLYADCTL